MNSIISGFLTVLLGLIIISVIIGIYLLPTLIANHRRHPNKVPIILLNVLLGWSFFGWVAALVWATTAIERHPPPEPERFSIKT